MLPRALLAASCSAAARARRSPPRRLPVSFFPARSRRRARHSSPSPSAGRCGARGAAPCKHRGACLGCGRATPRVRETRHPLLGREPGICISQSLAAGDGRGSGCGAGRSRGWDWGCRMRSVSFLRLGTGGRVGERRAYFPSGSESLSPPCIAFEILGYSMTPAAR